MATTEEIKKTAILVRDATQIGENTAERVGGVLVDLANKSKELEDNIKAKAEKSEVATELDKKFDKENIAQEFGDSEDKVMSQKAVSDKLSDLGTLILGQTTETALFRTIERPASDVETNESFGVLINRGETYMFKNVGEGTITLSIYGASTNEILKTFTLSPKQFVYYTQDSVDKTVGIKLVWKEEMTVDVNTTSSKFDTKLDKSSVVQNNGDSEELVMSQKAVSDLTTQITAQITETALSRTIERTANETGTTENFGVLINRGETYMFKNVGEGTITLSIYGASTNEILKTFTLSPNQFVYYTQDSVDKTVGIKLVWKDAIRIEIYRTLSKFDGLEAPLKGKKIFTYGDSLVANGGWQDYISSLGANVINSGIGGSTLSYRDRKQYVNKDGKYVGDPNENYTPKEGETLINDTGSGEQRMQYIAKDADYIIVLFGTNDCHQDKAIGTFVDEDNTTFKGAIKTLIKWIRTNRPLTKIVFLTPTIERKDIANNLSLNKIDYIKAILDAEIELNVPIVNLWSRTSWSKENFQNYSIDDIHWNDLGKKEIGKIIAGYLLSEL